MRPRVISHMVSTIDGKTDPRRLGGPSSEEYERTGEELGGNGWLCGRTTMERDFADYRESAPFVAKSTTKAGARAPHVAKKADAYAIAADTQGKLHWKTDDIDGDHLICLLSESVSADYLAMLEERGISHVVAGAKEIDFVRCLEVLGDAFGMKSVLLEGGGTINGAFVDAGLLDEVSVLVVPGIDGRAGVSAVFEGREEDAKPLQLELQSCTPCKQGILWLRYLVRR